MSRLDARWPLATSPWCPGTGGYAVHACRRVAIYDAAVATALGYPTATNDAQAGAGMVLSAIAAQPADERAAMRTVLEGEGLLAPIAGALVGWALDPRRLAPPPPRRAAR